MTTLYLEISSASFANGTSFNSVYLTLSGTPSGFPFVNMNWSVTGISTLGGAATDLTFSTGGGTYNFTTADLFVSQANSVAPFLIGGTSSSGTGAGSATLSDLEQFDSGLGFEQGSVTANGVYYPLQTSVTYVLNSPPCFAAGTLVWTPRGDVSVETLKTGDLVVTASGETRPVKWIGHADVDFRAMPHASDSLPIRIAADAFGPGRPSQDLVLSPGHSVCVRVLGEVLIPVGCLVNGSTIAQIEVDTIAYWHVELESHDVLIANSLAAESYLAMGNRAGFDELRGLPAVYEEGRERTHADFCRPVVTEGPTLGFIRRWLDARARELGWMAATDPELRRRAGQLAGTQIEAGPQMRIVV